ncbi:MAG TPA: VacB/RNase II family 3'-5' exoribonuclease [Candidatus Rubneribacter avistercoris]|nr:VacB/RNase II family 3'-5' exoribonuclease [Candidatus Rubneribacter avistercoris]
MGRSRSRTRRAPRANPRGELVVRGDGSAFARTAEGEFFVPESKREGAFGGDVVELVPLPARSGAAPSKGRPAARVVRVVERAFDTLVGRYEVADPFGVVVPRDPRVPCDVFTLRADRPDIEDGALVRVRITAFPSRNTAAMGVVEEVLGRADDGRAAVEEIIARHGLETSFSEAALAEAREAALDADGALRAGYRDLRERFSFTVDPVDARDFDDALSLERACPGEGGAPKGAAWRLGVHIADVSHYVRRGGPLDLDARRRATSVYLVDRVIPMLPEELSGDLCSLRPGEVRRTMTADLYLDKDACLMGCELYPALIRSDARLSYDRAQELLEGGVEAAGEEGLAWRLRALSRIAGARAAARERAGGLDFDTAEARVRLDAEGRPESVEVRRKTEATSLVEEAMILANETVARRLRDAGAASLYRVHEAPAPDDLASLVLVLREFAWFAEVDEAAFAAGEARALQRALAASAGRPEAELVSTLLLRSMKRAAYRASCEPHYGLASSAYTHFTSPIRRYPDLVAHRALKALLGGRAGQKEREEGLALLAEHASAMERVAERAARESQEAKLVEYLEGFVGQAFSATVSGAAAWGLYVRLDNTAEGLVPARFLGEGPFDVDAAGHRLESRDGGRSFRLGQRVAVALEEADARKRLLTFRLASPRGKGGGA